MEKFREKTQVGSRSNFGAAVDYKIKNANKKYQTPLKFVEGSLEPLKSTG